MFYFFKLFSTDVRSSLRSSTLNVQDVMFALLAVFSVMGLYSFFSWDHLHPQVWEGVVAALELDPEVPVQDGLWRYFVRAVVKFFPNCSLQYVLRVMGLVSGSFCAGVVFLTFRMMFPLLLKTHGMEFASVRFFVDLVLLALVWLLVLSEPYWNLFRFFTVQTSLLTLALSSVLMLIVFLVTFRVSCLLLCNLFTGLLAGSSFIGIVLLVVELVVLVVAKHRYGAVTRPIGGYYVAPASDSSVSAPPVPARRRVGMPLLNPLIAERIKTPLAVAILLGFALGIGADVFFSLRTPGREFGDVLLNACRVYLGDLRSFATAYDLVATFLLVVFPLFLNVWYCRRATDTDKFLPRTLSCMYFVTALVAYTQISAFGRFWYWTWGLSALMPLSPLYLALMAFGALGVVFTSVLVFLVDGCCRDFVRMLNLSGGDADRYRDEAEHCLGRSIVRGGRRMTRLKGMAFVVVVLAFCAASFVTRRQTDQHVVMEAIADFGAEVARESETCGTLVTNGALDDLVRLCLYVKGARAQFVHAGEEGVRVSKGDPSTGWMADLPALYLDGGWDFSGLVARRKVDARERNVSRKAVFDLAGRFAAFDRSGALDKTRDRFLKNVSCLIKWRLARVLGVQLQDPAVRADVEQSRRIEALERDLDRGNEALKSALAKFDGRGQQAVVELTPKEGLALAVNRGDYELARRYVDVVLRTDGDCALALFARGMICLKDERYPAAVEALTRAAAKLPKEAAVLNNLAVALARAGRRDKAREWILKARALPGADASVKANAEQLAR